MGTATKHCELYKQQTIEIRTSTFHETCVGFLPKNPKPMFTKVYSISPQNAHMHSNVIVICINLSFT